MQVGWRVTNLVRSCIRTDHSNSAITLCILNTTSSSLRWYLATNMQRNAKTRVKGRANEALDAALKHKKDRSHVNMLLFDISLPSSHSHTWKLTFQDSDQSLHLWQSKGNAWLVEQCFADLTYLITITVRIQMACRRRERMKQTADMMMDPGLQSSHASSGLVLAARRLLVLDLNQRILSTPDSKKVKHNGEQTSTGQCNN